MALAAEGHPINIFKMKMLGKFEDSSLSPTCPAFFLAPRVLPVLFLGHSELLTDAKNGIGRSQER